MSDKEFVSPQEGDFRFTDGDFARLRTRIVVLGLAGQDILHEVGYEEDVLSSLKREMARELMGVVNLYEQVYNSLLQGNPVVITPTPIETWARDDPYSVDFSVEISGTKLPVKGQVVRDLLSSSFSTGMSGLLRDRDRLRHVERHLRDGRPINLFPKLSPVQSTIR